MSIENSIDTEIYKDPENWETIVQNMNELKTMKDILDLMRKTFPNIVVGFLDGFSPDYPHLTEDWQKIVDELGVKRTQVMILDNVSYDENHKLVKHFCECFTRAGFAVKRKMEFVPCPNTGLAVPTELNHYIYKMDKRVIPEKYSLQVDNSD